MKKKILLLILIVAFAFSIPTVAFAWGSSAPYSLSTWTSDYETNAYIQRTESDLNHGYDDNTYAAYDGWSGTSYTSRIYQGTNMAGSVMNMLTGVTRTCEIQPPYFNNTNLALEYRLKVSNSHTSCQLGTVGVFGVQH